MEERKTQIVADDAFAEMDMSMDEAFEPMEDDEKYDELNKEMEAEALQLYERIFARRIAAYEREADEIGMLLALRAGYDPHQMLNLLARIRQMPNLEEGHYDAEQLGERIDFVQNILKKFTYPDQMLNQQSRWQSQISYWK